MLKWTGLYMTPNFSIKDIANGRMHDAVLNSQFPLTHTPPRVDRSYLHYFRFGELRVPSPLSLGRSSFLSHVSQILGVCCNKEMVGTHTGRIITTMAYEQTFGYRTERDFPRGPMRFDRSFSASAIDLAISRSSERSEPESASVYSERSDELWESFGQWDTLVSTHGDSPKGSRYDRAAAALQRLSGPLILVLKAA